VRPHSIVSGPGGLRPVVHRINELHRIGRIRYVRLASNDQEFRRLRQHRFIWLQQLRLVVLGFERLLRIFRQRLKL
jgi:hypothetical protein